LESKTVQQIQKERQQQGQESLDNCQVMREAIIKHTRSQLAFNNEMGKIAEVSRMHRHYMKIKSNVSTRKLRRSSKKKHKNLIVKMTNIPVSSSV
jgi:hypothetical protein